MRPYRRLGAAFDGLTFELRRDRRYCAWPARRIMNQGASRAKCNAVGPRLERGVRLRLQRTAAWTLDMTFSQQFAHGLPRAATCLIELKISPRRVRRGGSFPGAGRRAEIRCATALPIMGAGRPMSAGETLQVASGPEGGVVDVVSPDAGNLVFGCSVGRLAVVERPPERPSTARTFTPGRAQWTRVDGRRHDGGVHEARRLGHIAFCGA